MEIRQLICALEVMRQGSFTKAAEKLYISQPHLSQQVQKLETELGIILFNRTTHSLIPTERGIEFCQYAQDVVDAWDRLESSFNITKNTINIGILERFKTINLPAVIRQFHSLYPEISIKVNNYLEWDLHKKIEIDKLDIVFLRQSMLDPYINKHNFKCEMFLEETLNVLVSPTNILAKKEVIYAEQLKGFKFVAGKKGSSTYDKIIKTLNMAEKEESFFSVLTDNHDIMAEMVHEGEAITFGNKSVGDYYGLVSIPFYPDSYNNAYMVHPAKKKNTLAIETFINFIKDVYGGETWKNIRQYPRTIQKDL